MTPVEMEPAYQPGIFNIENTRACCGYEVMGVSIGERPTLLFGRQREFISRVAKSMEIRPAPGASPHPPIVRH